MKYISSILFLLFLSSCASVFRYETIIFYDENFDKIESQKAKSTIKVNTRFKNVKLEYLGEEKKYKIASYKYRYPLFTIFHTKKDRKGLNIKFTSGESMTFNFENDQADFYFPDSLVNNYRLIKFDDD